MKRLRDFIYSTGRNVANSIAFYPTLITLLFFLLALVMMMIEYRDYMSGLRDFLAPVLVKNLDDARLILGTLVGSIISLMVFSFSMVMIVLNRAASMLTPRVIPGLISRKSHQIVLGLYLGTIIFCLMLIVNIHPEEYKQVVPSIGILMAMIFGITSLTMFIYFIDDISSSIQTDNILQEIFKDTRQKMEATMMKEIEDADSPDMADWQEIYSKRTGYIKQIRMNSLISLAKEHELEIYLGETMGFFLVENYPFLKVSQKIDEEIEQHILDCFILYTEEHVGDHYIFGLKQISEIAVKALSPGINDPGTAVKAIDLLGILFIKRIQLHEKRTEKDEEDTIRFWYPEISLGKLLYDNLTPIRQYGKTDPTIMLKLLEMMTNLAYADIRSGNYQRTISEFVQSLVSSCRTYVDNSLDRDQLNRSIKEISRLLDQDIPELSPVAEE